jgi:tetratricopeptide (TPR) repeat protein
MPSRASRTPVLRRLYHRYLDDSQTATFIRNVAKHYTVSSLERLTASRDRETKRAAILSLGFLSDFRSNEILARSLRDDDRGVRLLAENGIRALWCRDGSEAQQMWLRSIVRLNNAGQWHEAVEQASWLLDEAPRFAEVWNQRAIARFGLGEFAGSIEDGRRTLECNRYHFAAAVGLAQSYLHLDQGEAALECLQHALSVNPDLEQVRVQTRKLERLLKRKN